MSAHTAAAVSFVARVFAKYNSLGEIGGLHEWENTCMDHIHTVSETTYDNINASLLQQLYKQEGHIAIVLICILCSVTLCSVTGDRGTSSVPRTVVIKTFKIALDMSP